MTNQAQGRNALGHLLGFDYQCEYVQPETGASPAVSLGGQASISAKWQEKTNDIAA